ncbi:hypothetical protein TEA_007691 [Camellia sinensis var. sinensis]|uniref:Uncharacterized protein n=1 Tax=Camellia sinensis var. sinensis TaxID=542762 RepID=A0A4S4EX68_CAMSN|nr:hypothetical protein TEA_007691 [Camellia sinensis var. sinensis]
MMRSQRQKLVLVNRAPNRLLSNSGQGQAQSAFMANLNVLNRHQLKELVKKHSEFISYPIYLWTEKTTEKEISDDEDEETKKEEFLVVDLKEIAEKRRNVENLRRKRKDDKKRLRDQRKKQKKKLKGRGE